MKKNYKILAGIMAMSSILSLDLGAQLSGVYTLDAAVPTGGTNYQSFSDLASDLNSLGISAPVTINVAGGSGPYNEQVEFMAITGSSAANVITINGNGNTITYAANSSFPHTMMLTGTDYMTINNLTIVGTDNNYAMSLHLWDDADNNNFNNCRFEAPFDGSYYQVPVSLSAWSDDPVIDGNTGRNNVWSNCTMIGGSYGITLCGNSGTPYSVGNQLINSSVTDYYSFGIVNYYVQGVVNRGNIVERLNQNNYDNLSIGIYLGPGCEGAVIEKNKIRKLFDANPGQSYSEGHGIYIEGSGAPGTPNVISNNLISDIASDYDVFGIYDGGYSDNNLINNTIVLDDANSTYGYVFGVLSYGSPSQIMNNLISVNRTGSGNKYCMYIDNATVNNNVLYNPTVNGNNYIGYYGNTGMDYTTFIAWQAAGLDQQGASGDPMFTNPSIYDYTPTNPAINNIGAPGLGINTDINNLARNLPAPDAGAFEFFNQMCSTVTGTNAVVATPTFVCPNGISTMMLANSYTVNGLSFTWGSAPNQIGPFVPISGATLATYVTPGLNADVYYNVIVGCVNGGSSVTATPALVQVAATTTNNIPYFEGFEGITQDNQLPNCSWDRTNTQQNRTAISPDGFMSPHTGNNYAYFDAGNTHGYLSYDFYTNGLQLYTGITYSAAVWYLTPGYVTWNAPEILIGTTQSANGSTMIATTAPMQPQNPVYALLSNTFQVTSSGIYYLTVRGTDNHSHNRLAWDDLSVTIPCYIPANAAPIALTGSTTICAGTPVNISASGANSYTWSTGENTSSITVTPAFNATYTVTGLNPVSGCLGTAVRNIVVNQLPVVGIYASDLEVCAGNPVSLTAMGGALGYTWSAGPTIGAAITVTPTTVNNTYTVMGVNAYGCTAQAVQQIGVNPLPAIAVSGNTLICLGNPANLTASGAGDGATYAWKSNSNYIESTDVVIYPNSTVIYTVTGTSSEGCEGTSLVTLVVEACVGIESIQGSNLGLSVYPNPNNGVFTIALSNGSTKTIEVVDVTGRLVLSNTSNSDLTDVNISALANGVYYVKVSSETTSGVIKIVKQ